MAFASSSRPHEQLPVPPDAPVVHLEWAGSLPGDLTVTPMCIDPSAPPPSYADARVPTEPVTYSFSRLQAGTSAMLLLPPVNHADTRPLYYICVDHDPVFPNLFTTSLFKGWNADCPSVGSFGTLTGPSSMKDNMQFVQFEGRRYLLTEALSYKKGSGFTWWPNKRKPALFWQCVWPTHHVVPVKCKCYIRGYSELLATFKPSNRTIEFNSDDLNREATLTVTPAGHKYLDAMTISSMLIERYALTPPERWE